MGPPPFGDGNLLRAVSSLVGARTLQWGHRLSAMETGSCSGDSIVSLILQWGHRLSAMETSRYQHGQSLRQRLQWGHRLSAMETTFNGGDIFSWFGLQWGHRLSAMETSWAWGLAAWTWWSFNGATAFRRWKPAQHPVPRCAGAIPSMGPPPFGDGNWTHRETDLRVTRDLQWGHRLSAMETREMYPAARILFEAFNGATAFRRWKLRRLLWE